MTSKNKYIVVLVVMLLALSSLVIYEKYLNNKLIEKHYKIGLITDCNLALEINQLVLEQDLIKKEEKRKIKSLSDILYTNGSLYSNYEIKNKKYLDKFADFSYFEDYAYFINQTIEDGILDDEEKQQLRKHKEKIIDIKDKIILQSEILD